MSQLSPALTAAEEDLHPRGLTIPLPRGGTSSSCSNFDFYLREKESSVSKSVPECLGEFWNEPGNLFFSPKKKSLPSPRNIPKFIKHSLNKLWRSKSESPSNSSSSQSQLKDPPTPDSSLEIYDSISMTQSTLDFIEETRLIGLPLIPFKYPSCYLHEGHKPLSRKMPLEEMPPNLSSIITEADRQLNEDEETRIIHSPPSTSSYVPESEKDFFPFPFIDDEAAGNSGRPKDSNNSADYIDMKPLGYYYPVIDGME